LTGILAKTGRDVKGMEEEEKGEARDKGAKGQGDREARGRGGGVSALCAFAEFVDDGSEYEMDFVGLLPELPGLRPVSGGSS
jgi:hypothetical protein